MNEFAPDMTVLIVDDHRIVGEYTVRDLLPVGFGPDHLPNSASD
jgi:cytidine deaminase